MEPRLPPQCVLGVSRGPTRLIQSDPRRVWGGWSHPSLSWTLKSSEVTEALGGPLAVSVRPPPDGGEWRGAAAYTGSSTQLERVTGLSPAPKLTLPVTWIYGFGHQLAGLLVIALIKTLTESGQGLSSGLSDPGGEWLVLCPTLLCRDCEF